MKLGVIGSRGFSDVPLLEKVLDEFRSQNEVTLIISGGAKGADKLAIEYADARFIPKQEFLPDWKSFGKKAGMMRNTTIVQNSDHVIAFWDSQSKGTEDSIRKCYQSGTPVTIIYYTEL